MVFPLACLRLVVSTDFGYLWREEGREGLTERGVV